MGPVWSPRMGGMALLADELLLLLVLVVVGGGTWRWSSPEPWSRWAVDVLGLIGDDKATIIVT